MFGARVAVLVRMVAEIPAALLVVAEVVVLFTGVMARYAFHAPLVWTDELASILFLWLAMLGSVIALQRSEHMRLTALVAGAVAGRARSDRGAGVGFGGAVPADGGACGLGLRLGPVVHRDPCPGHARYLPLDGDPGRQRVDGRHRTQPAADAVVAGCAVRRGRRRRPGRGAALRRALAEGVWQLEPGAVLRPAAGGRRAAVGADRLCVRPGDPGLSGDADPHPL